jgi:cytochrome P450
VVFDNLETVKYEEQVTEAMDILIAGADTTASTLTTGLIHILSNSGVERRLVEEIDSLPVNENGQLPLQALEKLEYLVCHVVLPFALEQS